tara:strand:+ start:5288 stop:6466 length:1179 start_codon:yes stop_codon:yes gene_type:complete
MKLIVAKLLLAQILGSFLSLNGQEPPVSPVPIVLDIDLSSYCQEQEALASPELNSLSCPRSLEETTSIVEERVESINAVTTHILGARLPLTAQESITHTCRSIMELSSAKVEPIEILKKDDEGNSWQIRFHFGNSRTFYGNTDMQLQSSRLNVVINDFEFEERTSASYWNPANWENFEDAFKWIDEPTNTFAITIEKKNNIYFITAFHPKFLKKQFQVKHVQGTVDGIEVDQMMPINEEFDGYNNEPGQMHLTRFENTHRQMDWQIGYGRRFVIFESDRAGKLSYIPRVDVGITSGQNKSVYLKEGEYWEHEEVQDKEKVQGVNASIGHRVEYQRGKVSIFADQKFTVSKLENGFMDGRANFNMRYMPVTVGIGVDLFKVKSRPSYTLPPAP